MTVQVFEYPSRSSDDIHKVTVGANNHLHCTCTGFRTPSKCWHVRDVAEKLGLPQTSRSTTPALLPFVRPEDIPPAPEPWASESGHKRLEANGLGWITDKPRRTFVDAPSTARPEYFFIEPMLGRGLTDGEKIDHWEGNSKWTLERKYDGMRVQLFIDENRIPRMLSRDQNVQQIARHLLNPMRSLAPGLYDGELFIPGKTHTDVKRKDLIHKHKLALFDVLMIFNPDGGWQTVTDLALMHRRKLLEYAMSQAANIDLFQSPALPVKADVLAQIWSEGGEGVMLKCLFDTYQPGRRVWIKFKKKQHMTVRIIGFLPGKLGPCSRIRCQQDNGIEIRCKTLDTKMRKAFESNPDSFVGRRLVIEYTEKTVGGRVQHPRAEYLED